MRHSLAEKLNIRMDDQLVGSKVLRHLLRESMLGTLVNRKRKVLERILEATLLDHDTYEWFLTQVAIVKNGQYGDNTTPLPMEKLNKILDEGLETLSDDELGGVATNPIALMCLRDEVWQADGETWEEVQTLIGEELRESWEHAATVGSEDSPVRRIQDGPSPKPTITHASVDGQLQEARIFAGGLPQSLDAKSYANASKPSMIVRELFVGQVGVLHLSYVPERIQELFARNPTIGLRWNDDCTLHVSFATTGNTDSAFRIDEQAAWTVFWGTSKLDFDLIDKAIEGAVFVRARGEQDFPMQDELTLHSSVIREDGDRLLIVFSQKRLGDQGGYVARVIIELDTFFGAAR